MTTKKMFTTGQVAKICGVSPVMVSRWVDRGILEGGFRLPGSQDRRIPRDKLIRFLKEHGMPLGELEDDPDGFKVLLIGASKTLACRLGDTLPARFYIREARSGFDAGQQLSTFTADLIIIDAAFLGRADALQIAADLRQAPGYDRKRLIMLAAEDDTDTEALKAYGNTEVFQRPFDPTLLAERILGGPQR